jgi:hypothetical protein
MNARIGRLAGAILAEFDDTFYLIGNTKAPCNWHQHGFVPPVEIDALKNPVLTLERCPDHTALGLDAPFLTIASPCTLSPQEAAHILAARFIIARNGSVSDRLWNLILGEDPAPESEASWLLTMPDHVWQVVRDTVLRCT